MFINKITEDNVDDFCTQMDILSHALTYQMMIKCNTELTRTVIRNNPDLEILSETKGGNRINVSNVHKPNEIMMWYLDVPISVNSMIERLERCLSMAKNFADELNQNSGIKADNVDRFGMLYISINQANIACNNAKRELEFMSKYWRSENESESNDNRGSDKEDQ